MSDSSVMSIPTLRAKEIVIGCRPMPSLEFQFILVSARILFGALADVSRAHKIRSEVVQVYVDQGTRPTKARIHW